MVLCAVPDSPILFHAGGFQLTLFVTVVLLVTLCFIVEKDAALALSSVVIERVVAVVETSSVLNWM